MGSVVVRGTNFDLYVSAVKIARLVAVPYNARLNARRRVVGAIVGCWLWVRRRWCAGAGCLKWELELKH